MDSENQFIATMTRYIITGFLVFVIACMGSCQASKYQIRKAIDAGATPLAAKCAMGSEVTNCALLFAAEAESNRQ